MAYTRPRPVESRKHSRPGVPAGTSCPDSSSTNTSNGGTALPTEPGWESHSAVSMLFVVPTSVPPYASSRIGPHQSIMRRLTSIGHAAPVWTTRCKDARS